MNMGVSKKLVKPMAVIAIQFDRMFRARPVLLTLPNAVPESEIDIKNSTPSRAEHQANVSSLKAFVPPAYSRFFAATTVPRHRGSALRRSAG